jgi:hypothetical protein
MGGFYMRKKKSLLISLVMCILLAFTSVYAEDFGDGSGFNDNSQTNLNSNYSPNYGGASSITGGGYRSAIKLKKGKTVTAYICTTELAKLKVSGSKYKWKSSNKKIATVSSKGIVTAKKKGTATITAQKGKTKYKCKLIVESPKLSRKTASINIGKTYQFKVTGTKQKVKWTSSNASILSINSKGKATAKKSGTVFVTAKVSTYKFMQSVDVVAPSTPTPVPGNNNTINNSTPVFNLGQTWTVPGQWRLTINYATEMTDRNPYSEKNPAAVYLIDYTYENIGYESNVMGGLYMSLDMEQIVDSNGYAGYTYPNSPIYYPQVIPVGSKCHAQCCIAVDHKGTFKIYVNEYAGNDYTKNYKAIFNVPIS